jgi:hypothetical protein
MHAAEAMTVTVTVAMTVAATMTPVSAAVTTAVAATLADRGARQQRHQNNDGNSDCPFGHGSLLRTPTILGHKKDADRRLKFHWRSRREARERALEDFARPALTPPARSFRD